jgi:hypothetical protein
LFSTAAAHLAADDYGPSALLAALHRMFAGSTIDNVELRQHHPKRYEFLERACLDRELDRL